MNNDIKTINKIVPIILAGGTGSRLWPLSRESYPKQFLPLLGENEQSLLHETISRIVELEDVDDPIIICNINCKSITF